MVYIYILYSSKFDKYYIGQTKNFELRLFQHNSSTRSTYTSKYRPWVKAELFEVKQGENSATKLERYIKRQKSKVFIKDLINLKFKLDAVLVQLPVYRQVE